MAPTQEMFVDTIVEMGVVVEVHPENWTVDVFCDQRRKDLTDVPWACPYLDGDGSGSYFFPEPGAQVLLLTLSDREDSPIVLGFAPRSAGSSWRNKRPRMSPGDHGLTTRGGGRVFVRRSGMVEVGSSSMARRFYFPNDHLIRDICQRYEMYTAVGSMAWQQDRTGDDRKGRFFLQAYGRTKNTSPVVEMSVGYTPEQADKRSTNASSLLSKSSMASSSPVAVHWSVRPPGGGAGLDFLLSEKGEVLWKTAGQDWTVAGNFVQTVKGDRAVTVEGTDSLSSKKRVRKFTEEERSGTSSSTKLSGPMTVQTPSAEFTNGTGTSRPVALLDPTVLQYLSTTPGVFQVAIPGVPAPVPVLPGPAMPGLLQLLQTRARSTTLKAT